MNFIYLNSLCDSCYSVSSPPKLFLSSERGYFMAREALKDSFKVSLEPIKIDFFFNSWGGTFLRGPASLYRCNHNLQLFIVNAVGAEVGHCRRYCCCPAYGPPVCTHHVHAAWHPLRRKCVALWRYSLAAGTCSAEDQANLECQGINTHYIPAALDPWVMELVDKYAPPLLLRQDNSEMCVLYHFPKFPSGL